MRKGTWKKAWLVGGLLGAFVAVQPVALAQGATAAAKPTSEAKPAQPAAAKPTPGEILAQVDRSKNGFDSFVVDVRITNYRRGAVDKVSNYQVSIKGANKSLVKFVEAEDKGKFLLTVDDFMWFYLRSASRPVRVTPLQRLSGNASNGDVAQTNLAENYETVSMTEEVVDGKPTYVLDLVAKRKSATYQGARYWVAKDSLLPLKAEFKLGSGKPSKRAVFVEYQLVDGRRVLRRQEIYDLLRNEEKTVLEYSNYVSKDLPDKMFNKNFRQDI
jgi:hypothetical protein